MESLELSSKVNGPKHPTTLKAMESVANIFSTAGRHDEAVKLARKWRELFLEVNGAKPQNKYTSAMFLSRILFAAGKANESTALLNQVATYLQGVDQQQWLDKDSFAADFEKRLSAKPGSREAEAFDAFMKTQLGREQLLTMYVKALSWELLDKQLAAKRGFAVWMKDSSSARLDAAQGPGGMTVLPRGGKLAWKLQQYLADLKDFEHPDYPGLKFTFSQNVLAAEPVRAR